MRNHTLRMSCFVLPIFVFLALIAESPVNCGCRDGWFGTECKMQCHCANSTKCRVNGECPPRSRCSPGFFGQACQYVDWVSRASLPHLVELFIRDSDDSTCNANKDDTHILLTTERPIMFTWLRIVTNSAKHLLNFSTTWNEIHRCVYERKYIVSNNTVDFVCMGVSNLTFISLEGAIVPSVCSVYISGGRNVALKQKTWQTSTLINIKGNFSSDYAVDGEVDSNRTDLLCARTTAQAKPAWRVTFDQPYLIYSLDIITEDDYKTPLTELKVTVVDESESETYENVQKSKTRNSYYQSQLTISTVSNTIVLTLLSSRPDQYAYLTLCEIEVYGECRPGYYGIYCNMTCSEGCAETCHPGTGMCSCKPKYTGGRCTECLVGFHGGDCNWKCPALCVDRMCHRKTGWCVKCPQSRGGSHCEECAAGLRGDHCNMTCPKFCKAGICDQDTGLCNDCAQNHIGHRCEECPPGFYKEYCNQTCSIGCLQNRCDAIQGKCACNPGFTHAGCIDCVVGFYGEHCNLTCPAMCANKLCSRKHALCSECIHNHVGLRCEECPEKFYGPECTTPCSSRCLDKKCYSSTGYCLSCHETYTGPQCDIENIFDNLTSSTVFCEMSLVTILALLLALLIIFV